MRSTLLVSLAVAIAIAGSPLAGNAQQTRVFRIGVLEPAHLADANYDAFREGLRGLGYVEGQNIVLEWRLAEGRYDRLPDLAADLVRRRVDVIVADSTPGIQAAKQATATIPVVMVASADPVGTGLVKSLARPGGNVTGLSMFTAELSGKRL